MHMRAQREEDALPPVCVILLLQLNKLLEWLGNDHTNLILSVCAAAADALDVKRLYILS